MGQKLAPEMLAEKKKFIPREETAGETSFCPKKFPGIQEK